MAEGIANKILPNNITIESAGTKAHGLNLNAIKVMADISIPISHHKSKKIDLNSLDNFDTIITLCGNVKDNCLILSDKSKHIHWDLEDPAMFKGNKHDTYNKYIEIRDIIFRNISKLKNKILIK